MNQPTLADRHVAKSFQGVTPNCIDKKIKDEKDLKAKLRDSLLDMNKEENRRTAEKVSQEFGLTGINGLRDDYRNFIGLVNENVKTKKEVSILFNILNGSPLGIHFLNKLNMETLQEESVREAFIAWAHNVTGVMDGIDEIDACICTAYNAILEDKRIHPQKEFDHASAMIKITAKNHSSSVFKTYENIWTMLQSTKAKNEEGGIVNWGKNVVTPSISQEQLGLLYTELLQGLKNSIHALTNANIIEPMIRDKSSIISILESYADRTIGNMDYLRWKQNDNILDEILDYLLLYYHRLIQAISEMPSFDNDDQDTFALKQLMEKFIILHKGLDLRIRALNTINTQSELSIYIVGRFLRRKLNKNVICDAMVLAAERNVKERALQIYDKLLHDPITSHEKRHTIKSILTECIMDCEEDATIRNYAVDILCDTKALDTIDSIKEMFVNLIECEANENTITRHCPVCGQTVTDGTIQQRTIQLFEIVLKDKDSVVSAQIKETIEDNIEMLILDTHEGVETRKLSLDILCRTRRSDEDAFRATKGLLAKIIENQWKSRYVTAKCPNCKNEITDPTQIYCNHCRYKLK